MTLRRFMVMDRLRWKEDRREYVWRDVLRRYEEKLGESPQQKLTSFLE
jgi:hypothetical protein